MNIGLIALVSILASSPVQQTPARNTVVAGGGGGSWVPTDTANLLWWVDANDTATTYQDAALSTPASANNAPVGGLKDKSGNLKHATQSTSGNRPLLKTSDKNSKSTLLFDGTDDALISATWSVSSQPWTLFVVCQNVGAAPRPILSGVAKRNLLGTGAILFRIYADTGADFADTTVAVDSNWHVVKIVFNGASSKFAFDGAADSTFVANPGTGGSEGVTLGAYETLNLFGNVKIAEMFIYAGTISSGDSTSAFSYLNSKWAVY